MNTKLKIQTVADFLCFSFYIVHIYAKMKMIILQLAIAGIRFDIYLRFCEF